MLVSNANPRLTQKKADKKMSFGAIPFKARFNEARHLIENTDIRRVSKQFQNIGIPTDFAGNKVVAACSGLTTNIFMKLGLKPPTGLFVTDFKRLNTSDSVIAFCLPALREENIKSFKNLGINANARSIIFNSNFPWSRVDELEDIFKKGNNSSSNHFLHTFIHEFSHNAHLDHIYTKFGYPYKNNLGYKVTGAFEELLKKNGINIKDGEEILNDLCTPFITTPKLIQSRVSNYGATRPTEFVAEHMTDVITSFLDPKTCMPTVDPFIYSQFINGGKVDKLFKQAWEGKFPKC